MENSGHTAQAAHGYERDGHFYRVTRPGTETVAFFCHFGAATMLLSHLINVSAMQLLGRQDTLVVDPGEAVLSDFIMVPLKKKTQYRRFKEEKMDENPYTVLDMEAFDITPWGDDAFRLTPRVPLKAGEYVIHCLKSERVGERGDYEVYPISVK